MEYTELNEQEVIRRDSLKAIRELGIDPYPAEKYEVNINSAQIREQYDPEKNNLQEITIAGRIMMRRIMGAASFIELQDEIGRAHV